MRPFGLPFFMSSHITLRVVQVATAVDLTFAEPNILLTPTKAYLIKTPFRLIYLQWTELIGIE